MDGSFSLGAVSKRGCFFWSARARNAHVEATLNHPFPAQARPFDERFPEDFKWAQEIFESVETSDCEEVAGSAGKVAKIAARHAQLIDDKATVACILGQHLIWTHSRFRSRHVRFNAKTKRCRVDGCEMGQIHCRLADLYHFFVWDETKDGLAAGKAALRAAQGCEGGQLQRLISRSLSTRFGRFLDE